MLALAGALAIFSVVRLAYVARRDEVEILHLVGAPLLAIRGPFLVEGGLQAGGGALLGVLALALAIRVLHGRVGEALWSVLPGGAGVGLSWMGAVLLVVGAALIGTLAAAMAWRSAARDVTLA
jgi:cell division protein FtsX